MTTVDSIWKWLKDGGFDRPRDGAMVDVTKYPGGCFRLTVETFGSKCERCATWGSSPLTRLLGSCWACTAVSDAERRAVRILANSMIPLLREDFKFQDDEAVREHGYSRVRDGVHDNGAVVTIFLKEKINQ